MKLIYSVVADWIILVLTHTLHPAQQRFIPGQIIWENVESLNSLLSTKHVEAHGYALIFDMEKAYNRVDWEFLERVIINADLSPGMTALITDF